MTSFLIQLLDRLRQLGSRDTDQGCVESGQNLGAFEDGSSTPRNQLIIKLSQQVTTLDIENQELRQELEKTKRLLQKFELKERGIRRKSRTKHERQELCVKMTSLELNSSTSKLELHG